MKRHLKRLMTPRFWNISKKASKWAVKPRAGPHKTFESIPLLVVVRDILELADDGKEAKSIIKMHEIFVDGKHRRDHKYPVGLMDVVSVPKLKKNYIVVPTKKGLELVEAKAKDSKSKVRKITGKRSVRGGKMQLNFHDGTNILVANAKDAAKYNTGDSVVVEFSGKKIVNHFKMSKGSTVVITKGKNIGRWGKIEEVIVTKTKEPTKIMCDVENEKLEVIKDYVFVIGEKSPIIDI